MIFLCIHTCMLEDSYSYVRKINCNAIFIAQILENWRPSPCATQFQKRLPPRRWSFKQTTHCVTDVFLFLDFSKALSTLLQNALLSGNLWRLAFEKVSQSILQLSFFHEALVEDQLYLLLNSYLHCKVVRKVGTCLYFLL